MNLNKAQRENIFFSSVILNAELFIDGKVIVNNRRMIAWKQFLVCSIDTRLYGLISNEIEC